MVRKLTARELVALRLLVEHGELFGLELVERSGGRLARGTVYVVLAELEDHKLLDSRQCPGDRGSIPRRKYIITGEGRAALKEHMP